MAGYSGTPLAKKLGIKAGFTVFASGAPADYASLLAPLPGDVKFVNKLTKAADLIHLFTKSAAELDAKLRSWRHVMKPDGTIWISWPKKASKVPTDITEDVIREVALPMGFVDVKVCAVDETWSGLKLVVRKELRQVPSPSIRSQDDALSSPGSSARPARFGTGNSNQRTMLSSHCADWGHVTISS